MVFQIVSRSEPLEMSSIQLSQVKQGCFFLLQFLSFFLFQSQVTYYSHIVSLRLEFCLYVYKKSAINKINWKVSYIGNPLSQGMIQDSGNADIGSPYSFTHTHTYTQVRTLLHLSFILTGSCCHKNIKLLGKPKV